MPLNAPSPATFVELSRLDEIGELTRVLVDCLPGTTVFILDRELRLSHARGAALDAIEVDPESVSGRPVTDLLDPSIAPALLAEYRAVLAGEMRSFDTRTADGKRVHWVTGVPVGDRDGKPVGALVIARDVTERVDAEAGFTAVFNNALDAVVLATDDRRFVRANPAAGVLLGLAAHELDGRSLDEFVPTDERDDHVGGWRAFVNTGEQRGRVRLVRASGEERIADFAAVANVLPGLHLSVLRDITEQIRAEEALREATDRFSAAFEHAPNGMALVALDGPEPGRPLAVNRALCTMFGYSEDELLELPPAELGHPDDDAVGAEEIRQLLAGEVPSVSIEKRFRRRDGSDIWARMQVSVIRSRSAPCYSVCQIEDITERKHAADTLRESEARFRRLADNAEEVVFLLRLSPTRQFEYVSPAATRVTGYTPEEFYADPQLIAKIVHPDDTGMLGSATSAADLEQYASLRWVKKDGSVVWTEQRTVPIHDRHGTVVAVQGAARDVTGQRLREEENRRLAAIVESTPDAILSSDAHGVITSWNRGAERLYGYSREEAIGRSVSLLVPTELEDEARRISGLVQTGSTNQYETQRLRKDGARIDVSLTVSPLTDTDGRIAGASAIARDISERKRLERDLRHQADHDPLTGLFNRRRFEQALDHHARMTKRAGGAGAVIMIDIDNFKFVNDSFGHRVGDDLLIAVADTLRGGVRSTDVVGRLGGDEFAVLLTTGDMANAVAVVETLLADIRGLELPARVTASAGIAVFEARTRGRVEDLMIAADIALYQAKESGRNRAQVFTGREGETFTWFSQVRAALAEDRLVLHAQPIVDLASGEIAQQELLVRMVGEDGKVIPPGSFLPTAERFGLISEIDRWVVRQAIGMAHAGHRSEVNISGRSIGDTELLTWIAAEVERSAIDPGQLIFEITETAAIANLDEAQRFAARLIELGCGVALDDFGTGFGSFTYLKHLPVSHIKIDMEFVRGIARSAADQRIVAAIVAVARGMDIQTIAEGVEDGPTLELLRGYGVDFAQGYHIARPAPIELPGAPGAGSARRSIPNCEALS